MRLKNIAIISFMLAAAMFPEESSHATILIQPGIYEIPALVIKGPFGVAVFLNHNTRSECRIVLTGQKSENLLTRKMPIGLLLKLRVSQPIKGSSGQAELLDFNPLENHPIPWQVGNNFIPIKKQE